MKEIFIVEHWIQAAEQYRPIIHDNNNIKFKLTLDNPHVNLSSWKSPDAVGAIYGVAYVYTSVCDLWSCNNMEI